MTSPKPLVLVLPFVLLPLACSGESGGDGDDANTGGELGAGGSLDGDGGASGGDSSAGGSGDSGGNSGTGGGGSVANPSSGCGNAGRPDEGKVYQAGDSWLVFPEKYDGTTPLPVLFGFHGCGAYNFGDENRTEFWDVTRGSGFETDYVVAIPLADSGSCFEYAVDIARAKALYDELVENYCVDMDRVFATGHSSGAGFLNQILASGNEADFNHFNFRGIAPVASWLIGSQSTQVPTMYIQGVTDSERGGGNGKDVVDKFVDVNQCSDSSAAYAVDACSSGHDGDPVTPGCITYDACDVATIWCSHDDSAYDGTFHGIPCFYKQAVYDFFASL
jgi:hypothetical protein